MVVFLDEDYSLMHSHLRYPRMAHAVDGQTLGIIDYLLCPGSGEFDLCLCGVGKIEPEV